MDEERVNLRALRTLKLGGRKGLLARHLPAIAQDGDGNWSLTAQELLRLDNAETPEGTGILFDMTPCGAEQKCILSLVDVRGRTMSLVTDALFHFKVITEIEPHAAGTQVCFVVKHWRSGSDRHEQMRLDGGFAGGNWAWAVPPLAVGAMVLHPL